MKASFPVLNEKDLVGAYCYSDAYMDDDRLVFETMRSAAHLARSAANYVKAVAMPSGRMVRCRRSFAEDALTGAKILDSRASRCQHRGAVDDIVGEGFIEIMEKNIAPG